MKVIKLNVENVKWSDVSRYINNISPERKKRISRLRKERDKLLSLISELLVRYKASDSLNIPRNELKFGYNNYGKPFLPDFPDYYFSISHSENCVAFAQSKKPVGIDIEHFSERRLKIAERFFTENEYKFINASKEPDWDFFRIWTSKEAYVKMLGVGLSKPLRSFDVLSEELRNDLCSLKVSDYMLTVCCENIAEKGFEIEETEGNGFLKEYG